MARPGLGRRAALPGSALHPRLPAGLPALPAQSGAAASPPHRPWPGAALPEAGVGAALRPAAGRGRLGHQYCEEKLPLRPGHLLAPAGGPDWCPLLLPAGPAGLQRRVGPHHPAARAGDTLFHQFFSALYHTDTGRGAGLQYPAVAQYLGSPASLTSLLETHSSGQLG